MSSSSGQSIGGHDDMVTVTVQALSSRELPRPLVWCNEDPPRPPPTVRRPMEPKDTKAATEYEAPRIEDVNDGNAPLAAVPGVVASGNFPI